MRAFELARKVRQLGLDARVEVWLNDWAELLKRGRLATEISGGWMAGHTRHSGALADFPAVLAAFDKYDQPVIYMDSEAYTNFILGSYVKEKRTIERLGLGMKS